MNLVEEKKYPEPKTIIQLRKVSHTYKEGILGIENINLQIHEGELIAIIGANGSGKTTLAKHIAGLLTPSSGMVSLYGEPMHPKPLSTLARTVGFVFQNPDRMLFKSSVQEEIAFGPINLKLGEEEIRQRIEKTLKLLNLAHLKDEHPLVLALGDRQRVAFASILAMDQPVFVFDEVTTGQDTFGISEIEEWIRYLHSQGKTIIFITHDLALARRLAHRIIVLDHGEIYMDGPPADIFSQTSKLKTIGLHVPYYIEYTETLPTPKAKRNKIKTHSDFERRFIDSLKP